MNTGMYTKERRISMKKVVIMFEWKSADYYGPEPVLVCEQYHAGKIINLLNEIDQGDELLDLMKEFGLRIPHWVEKGIELNPFAGKVYSFYAVEVPFKN